MACSSRRMAGAWRGPPDQSSVKPTHCACSTQRRRMRPQIRWDRRLPPSNGDGGLLAVVHF